MNLSQDKQQVYCHICKKWLSLQLNVYGDDNSIKCLDCDTVLGYKHDLPKTKEVNDD